MALTPKKVSLKSLIANILDCLPFYLQSYSPTNYTFTANQYRKLSRQIATYTGYTPIVIQANCTSHSALHVFNYYIDGDTLYYEVINRTSSSISGAEFALKVLYINSQRNATNRPSTWTDPSA